MRLLQHKTPPVKHSKEHTEPPTRREVLLQAINGEIPWNFTIASDFITLFLAGAPDMHTPADDWCISGLVSGRFYICPSCYWINRKGQQCRSCLLVVRMHKDAGDILQEAFSGGNPELKEMLDGDLAIEVNLAKYRMDQAARLMDEDTETEMYAQERIRVAAISFVDNWLSSLAPASIPSSFPSESEAPNA